MKKLFIIFTNLTFSISKQNEKDFVSTRKYCGKVSKVYGLLVIYD